MGGSFQVHVFSDPGMEMMLESDGWMCKTTVKTVVLEWLHFFHLFSKLMSGGMILGVVLVSFGDLGDTFSDF